MNGKIEINCHSSIKIFDGKTIYVDPFRTNEVTHDADYIFITHSHYDHFSREDILRVAKIDTIFITTEDTKSSFELMGVPEKQVIVVTPCNNYEIGDIKFETVRAYNIDKKFHPKENNWVGYIISLNGVKYYIAGDTDDIDEVKNIKCDIAFLPIGGTYTMNAKEAANLANTIDCKKVVPIHYGEIVGTREDLEEFINYTNKEVEVLIKK
jgi:L-ascorbate metabolism protein UlaG (beta-lactamase superfamily)